MDDDAGYIAELLDRLARRERAASMPKSARKPRLFDNGKPITTGGRRFSTRPSDSNTGTDGHRVGGGGQHSIGSEYD
jgi:hypothetical protein